MSEAASLTDTIGPTPPTSGTSLEWPSHITEGSHHFTETKGHSIGFFFPLTVYMLGTLSNIQYDFFLLIVTGLLVQWDLVMVVVGWGGDIPSKMDQ